MSSSLQIIGPDVIDLIEGTTLDSLDFLPPGGLAIGNGASGAIISVTLASSVSLSASSAGGATVTNGAGALTLSGDLAQVDAALASLLVTSTIAGLTTLSMVATDGTSTASTTFAVDTLPDQAPAFTAPASSLALTAGVAAPLGLSLADDPAVALGLLGAAPEALTVTLVASSGVLLLDPAQYSGIGIAGDATGTIVLSATSAQFALLNQALAAVSLDAASGGSLLYNMSQTSGPLPITNTSGSLTYSTSGTIAADAEAWNGQQFDWQSATAWSGGFAPGLGTDVSIGNGAIVGGFGVAAGLTIAPTSVVHLEGDVAVGSLVLDSGGGLILGDALLSVTNDLTINGSVLFVGADGTLDAQAVTVGAEGALINLGAATLNGLDAQGFAQLPGGAILNGPLAVASGGQVDFGGIFQMDSAASTVGLVAISVLANATIDGAGTLIAGNFSESETIAGPGTILALGPAPLTISAGSIGGGVHLVIDPGAALELAPVGALFGVFNNTPVTVGSDATISFAPGATSGQDSGTYASTLGEQGGVLVLDNPESFAGTILNFLPGDRIDFPTLTSLSLFNITSSGFEVQGVNSANTTQSEIITIHTSLATGLNPAIETDQAGDQVIGVRPATASLTLNDVPASLAVINAVSAIETPIESLGLLVPSDGTSGLVLTISASHGTLSDGGAGTSTVTLSAANALDLNNDLGNLRYTAPGSGSGDVLDFTGGTGLAGLTAAIGVGITAPGTLDYTGGNGGAFNADSAWSTTIAPANGDLAIFGSQSGAPLMVTGPGVAGAVSIGGWYDFAGPLDFAGSAGTALDIGSGFALFDANAIVTLGNALIVGDGHGAGALGVAGTMFAPVDIAIGGAGTIAGSLLDVTGSLLLGQTITIGAAAAATLDVTGVANFAATTLGGTASGEVGLVRAAGSAVVSLGSLTVTDGSVALCGTALVNVDGASLALGLITLAGHSTLGSTNGFDLTGGTLAIGAGAIQTLGPSTLVQSGGTLDLGGLLTGAGMTSSASTTIDGGAMVLSGTLSLASGGTIDLARGTIDAAGLTLDAGSTLSGFGMIGNYPPTGVGTGLMPIQASGLIEASGGTLILGGGLAGDVTIAASAALDIAGADTFGTISFAGADAGLTLNNVAAMFGAVANFAAGDALDLIGVAPTLVTIAGGTITAGSLAAFAFTEAAGQAPASVASDGFGGSLITVGGAMPCFTRGTHLLTPDGYRPVETLQPGDPLITSDGDCRPIRWIGRRTIDLARDPAAALLRPVVIAPGAFGPRCPRRTLAVSPLHAIAMAGRLIPAVLLVNNATITRDDTGFAITYYHVELDHHAIVLAEGLRTETYRDNGNRNRFLETIGTPGRPVPSCLPLVLGGADLHAARLELHQRARALDYKIIHGPIAHAHIGSAAIAPRRHGRRLMFDLPVATDHVTLHCRIGMASDTDPGSEDRRTLGICAGTLRADGRSVDRWHGEGWHQRAPADRGLWSTARADLCLPRPARRLSLEIVGSVPRWERNAAAVAL